MKSTWSLLVKIFIGFGLVFALPIGYMSISEHRTNHPVFGVYYHLFIVLFFISLVLLICYFILYFTGIRPVKKDIRYGKGIKRQYQIINKSYFPLTNDYFLFLDNKDPENVKVDSLSYKHFHIGDYYSLNRAVYSDVIFEDFDRFEIL